jgi:hypothetical protein
MPSFLKVRVLSTHFLFSNCHRSSPQDVGVIDGAIPRAVEEMAAKQIVVCKQELLIEPLLAASNEPSSVPKSPRSLPFANIQSRVPSHHLSTSVLIAGKSGLQPRTGSPAPGGRGAVNGGEIMPRFHL